MAIVLCKTVCEPNYFINLKDAHYWQLLLLLSTWVMSLLCLNLRLAPRKKIYCLLLEAGARQVLNKFHWV
jgi:hypothetical protein